jgi:hypothetical protein
MKRSTPSRRPGAEPPLWSIAAAAGVIILTPMLLYSLAPEGPIREGDTVFSSGPTRYRSLNLTATGRPATRRPACSIRKTRSL